MANKQDVEAMKEIIVQLHEAQKHNPIIVDSDSDDECIDTKPIKHDIISLYTSSESESASIMSDEDNTTKHDTTKHNRSGRNDNDNVTGLWIQDEEIQFVLHEDKRDQIIGFMKYKGRTEAHCHGCRKEDDQYEITMLFIGEHKVIETTANLQDNYTKLHLVKVGTDLSWDLQLKNKQDIPEDLFHELVCCTYF